MSPSSLHDRCVDAPRASFSAGGRSSCRSRARPDHRDAGFTYIGVMILVAILAMVSAAVLSAGSALQRRMNEEELLFVGSQFAEAFRSYFEATPAGQRNYPAKLEELLRDPRYPGVRRHLRRIYVDPMTGKPEWGLVPAPNGIVGVHSLSQRSTLKVAEFGPAFAALLGKKTYDEWKFGFAPPELVIAVPLAGTITPIVRPGAQKPAVTPPGAPTPTVPVPAPGQGSPSTFQTPAEPPAK